MTYSVNIPSAGRAPTLVTKTLPMLLDGGVDPGAIRLWNPSDEEREFYLAEIARSGLPEIEVGVVPHDPSDKSLDLVGVRPVSIGLARNSIIREHSPGDNIMFFDDDLTGISRAVSPTEKVPVEDLDRFIRSGFRDADAAACTLWGVYPVPNPYFMKPRRNTKLTYIPAACFGVRVTGEDHELVVLDDKEDYERSIRHYLRDGRVLRVEDVCMGTSGYAGAGGMQISRTPDRVRLSAEWIVARWPELAKLNTGKKSGWVEVRLRDARPSR